MYARLFIGNHATSLHSRDELCLLLEMTGKLIAEPVGAADRSRRCANDTRVRRRSHADSR